MSNRETPNDPRGDGAEGSGIVPMLSNPELLLRSNRRLIAGRIINLPRDIYIGAFADGAGVGIAVDVIDGEATEVNSTRGSEVIPSLQDEAKDYSGGNGSSPDLSISIPPYNDKTSTDMRGSTSGMTITSELRVVIAEEVKDDDAIRSALAKLGYRTALALQYMAEKAETGREL